MAILHFPRCLVPSIDAFFVTKQTGGEGVEREGGRGGGREVSYSQTLSIAKMVQSHWWKNEIYVWTTGVLQLLYEYRSENKFSMWICQPYSLEFIFIKKSKQTRL
jgi:hypothetical protein